MRLVSFVSYCYVESSMFTTLLFKMFHAEITDLIAQDFWTGVTVQETAMECMTLLISEFIVIQNLFIKF